MAVTLTDIERQLAAQPAPNPMGKDRFQITERAMVQGWDTTKPPEMAIVHRGPWETF